MRLVLRLLVFIGCGAVAIAQGGGPSRAEIDAPGPQVGQRPPDFTLPDRQGQPRRGQAGVEATRASTNHLSLVASASDALVAPGTRFSLVLDITPKPRMHVYAPGATDYQPIVLAIDPQPGLILRETRYPKPEILDFQPLDEHVPVYGKPFRIVQDATLDASRQGQALFKGKTSITITGKVSYQACDDKVCFIPATVPIAWTLKVRPLDMERVKQ